MYSIIASLDEGFIRIMQIEGIDIDLMLKFAILRTPKSGILFFHTENQKNIRLNVESCFFLILNSVSRQNHSYLNEYAGELIVEIFLDIINHE